MKGPKSVISTPEPSVAPVVKEEPAIAELTSEPLQNLAAAELFTAVLKNEREITFSELGAHGKETITAKNATNLRNMPSQGEKSKVMVTLKNGQTATRIGISDTGWSKVVYEGQVLYCVSSYVYVVE